MFPAGWSAGTTHSTTTLRSSSPPAAYALGDWLSPGAQPAWLDAAIEKALAARTAEAARDAAGSPAPRVTPEKTDAPAQRSAFLRSPPTMQRWNVEMRQALSVDVSKLPPECLNDVVKIVLKRQPENGAEVTIDFNTISEPVCDELRAFVEKSRAESTAKATLESCADGGPCPWIKKDAPPPPEAPPSSDRPYLLYAAVAVAAVAAVVVMRRRR